MEPPESVSTDSDLPFGYFRTIAIGFRCGYFQAFTMAGMPIEEGACAANPSRIAVNIPFAETNDKFESQVLVQMPVEPCIAESPVKKTMALYCEQGSGNKQRSGMPVLLLKPGLSKHPFRFV